MAIFFKAGDGCMANDPSYWRATRTDSEGGCIIACGATEDQAENLADNLLIEREKFLNLDCREQLKKIVSKDRILSSDIERAIKLIAKLIC